MTDALNPSVCREIERLFLPGQRRAARSVLSRLQLPLDDKAPQPRIHVALLWISAGDLTRLNQLTREAERDWRDTLVAAGLADEDWKDCLRSRGIACEDWQETGDHV